MLKAVTSTAGEPMILSGQAKPYPGKLGVMKSVADLLCVDGDSRGHTTVIGAIVKWFHAEPGEQDTLTIRLTMKDGGIYTITKP